MLEVVQLCFDCVRGWPQSSWSADVLGRRYAYRLGEESILKICTAVGQSRRIRMRS